MTHGSLASAKENAEPVDPGLNGYVASPPAQRALSLTECFARAERSNKDILVARWNLDMARAGVTIAGALPNPQFQLQEGFGESFRSLKTGQSEMIQWTQEILTAGKRSKRLEQAKANYFLARFQYDALRFNVHNQLRRAYYELAAAEAYQNLVQSQKEVGGKLLAIAQKRFAAGMVPESEVLQAKLSVSQFDIQANQAQTRLQQDSAALAQIIGESPDKVEVIDVTDNGVFRLSVEKNELVPSPDLELPAVPGIFELACRMRPDFKAAEQQLVVNRKALTLARAMRVPDIFATSGYQWSQWSKRQAPETAPVPNSIGNGAYVNLSMEAPIFYQHQGEIVQALSVIKQSERQIDLLKNQIASDLLVAHNRVSVARANIELYRHRMLPLAAEVARLARRSYEVGRSDLATAILAQQQYQSTLSSYFDLVTAYQNAWADVEQAVGVPLK
jgi:cobalt-zinc-cadmium efflux system outer membrane protein